MSSNRLLPAALGLMLAAFAAHAATLAEVRERGMLQIAVYEDFPPFSSEAGGRATGIDVDIGRGLADHLGLPARIRLVGADETMEDDLRNNVWKGHYLGGGTADVMLHVPVDAEFAEKNDRVQILAPYHRERIVMVSNPERVSRPVSLGSFEQEKIGVQLDTLADFYLAGAWMGRLRDNVVHFQTVGEATQALKAGEVAGVMSPRSEVEAGLGAEGGTFQVDQIPLPGIWRSEWDLGIAIKVGAPQLAEALASAMADMKARGEIQTIFAKHGITYTPPQAAAGPTSGIHASSAVDAGTVGEAVAGQTER